VLLAGHGNPCLFGTFRFHEEFQWAVQALASGKVNVDPILSDPSGTIVSRKK
jgi:hypothetical protein